MDSHILVDCPKGTYKQFRKKTNTIMIYQYTKHYRDEKGRPRHKSVMIGKLDEATGKLIPNHNYYDHNGIQPPSLPFSSVFNYGYTYSFYELSSMIGLTSILQETFGDDCCNILTIAAYMLSEGTVMEYLDDWAVNHYTESPALNGRFASSLFSRLDSKAIDLFFTKWIHNFSDTDCFFYDVTSISTYSKNIVMAEYGYNRDHEDLAQINLGMFCHNETRLPVYYNVYNGSLTDKNNLTAVIENAKQIGIKNIHLVMDGGFYDRDRIRYLDSCGYTYTVGMPSGRKQSKEIILKYGRMINEYEYKMHRHNEYCRDLTEKGKRILLCFNETLRADMMHGLVEKIDKLKIELNSLKRYPAKHIKKYSRFFKLTELEDGSFKYEEDIDKIKEYTASFGYFLLTGNDFKTDAEELLYYYRAKDADEKIFKAVKNYLEGNRIRTHNDRTTSGKIFIIFIAVIIRSEMFRRLEEYLHINNMTLKKAVLKLNDIRLVKGNDGYRLLKNITKEQRELLEKLQLDKKIKDSITKL